MNLNKTIATYYEQACFEAEKWLSKSEYNSLSPLYSVAQIEEVFGSWKALLSFCKGATDEKRFLTRVSTDADKILVTFVHDGTEINEDVFDTLVNYSKINKTELYVLWGKGLTKKDRFCIDVFEKLKPYLVTELYCRNNCQVSDMLVPPTQKNPLLNVDKITTNNIKTFVIGATKQYLKILPYKQSETYRVACSTGTISEIDYKETVGGHVDSENHTYGGILLNWNNNRQAYDVRTLIYKEGSIYDLDRVYTSVSSKVVKNIPGMVLGDIHFPDEDPEILNKTSGLLKILKPKEVILHDIASWQSVSHHEQKKYLSKILSQTALNKNLETEFNAVTYKLQEFAKTHADIKFKIVNSNHDQFITKWLDKGEFIKEKENAEIGAKLFAMYLKNKSILSEHLPANVKELPRNTSYKIAGFEVGEHGDCGISGSKGSPKQFSKAFCKSIIGHTHSPEIWESTTVVGTTSKLKMNYNQQGLTCWAHCHAIIHRNGTSQLYFL